MRVLVTGATGFVGRAVVRRLLLAGHQPVALVHQRTAPFPGSVEVVSGSILDQDALNEAVAGVDAVCHLAAITRGRESFADPLHYFRVNVDGTLNMLQALAKANTPTPRIVFTSTCLVYGEPAHQPISEAVVPQPTSPYGQAKLAAEWAVAAYARTGAAGATIIRTFNAAGAVDGITDADETRIIPRAIAVAAGRADVLFVNGDGSVIREYVHVDDLAVAVVIALDACRSGECRTYNVGSGIGTSLKEVITAVEAAAGHPLQVEHRPPAVEPQALVSDSTLARRELGWQPVRSDLRLIVGDAWAAEVARGHSRSA
jgi:UDP-glucose 4-epimerase